MGIPEFLFRLGLASLGLVFLAIAAVLCLILCNGIISRNLALFRTALGGLDTRTQNILRGLGDGPGFPGANAGRQKEFRLDASSGIEEFVKDPEYGKRERELVPIGQEPSPSSGEVRTGECTPCSTDIAGAKFVQAGDKIHEPTNFTLLKFKPGKRPVDRHKSLCDYIEKSSNDRKSQSKNNLASEALVVGVQDSPISFLSFSNQLDASYDHSNEHANARAKNNGTMRLERRDISYFAELSVDPETVQLSEDGMDTLSSLSNAGSDASEYWHVFVVGKYGDRVAKTLFYGVQWNSEFDGLHDKDVRHIKNGANTTIDAEGRVRIGSIPATASASHGTNDTSTMQERKDTSNITCRITKIGGNEGASDLMDFRARASCDRTTWSPVAKGPDNPNDWSLAIDLMASAVKEHFKLADIESPKDQDKMYDAAIWMLAIACVSASDLVKPTATVMDLRAVFLRTRDYMGTRPFQYLRQLQLGNNQKAQLRQISKSLQGHRDFRRNQAAGQGQDVLTELSRWIDDQVQFAIEMDAILPTDERSIFVGAQLCEIGSLATPNLPVSQCTNPEALMSRIEAQAEEITELDMCLESGNPEHDSYHDRKLRVMREVQRMILGNDELETFVQELTAQR